MFETEIYKGAEISSVIKSSRSVKVSGAGVSIPKDGTVTIQVPDLLNKKIFLKLKNESGNGHCSVIVNDVTTNLSIFKPEIFELSNAGAEIVITRPENAVGEILLMSVGTNLDAKHLLYNLQKTKYKGIIFNDNELTATNQAIMSVDNGKILNVETIPSKAYKLIDDQTCQFIYNCKIKSLEIESEKNEEESEAKTILPIHVVPTRTGLSREQYKQIYDSNTSGFTKYKVIKGKNVIVNKNIIVLSTTASIKTQIEGLKPGVIYSFKIVYIVDTKLKETLTYGFNLNGVIYKTQSSIEKKDGVITSLFKMPNSNITDGSLFVERQFGKNPTVVIKRIQIYETDLIDLPERKEEIKKQPISMTGKQPAARVEEVCCSAIEKNKEYYFSTCAGIGDLVVARGLFESFIQNGSKVFWSPSNKVISGYRKETSKQYTKFCLDFMNLISPNKLLTITDNEYNMGYTLPIQKKYKIKAQFVDLRNCLVNNKYGLAESNYIVIHTKVRAGHKDFGAVKLAQDIVKYILNNYKGKIVVIGEKVIEPAIEYQSLSVTSLYQTLISKIPKDRLIDLTIPSLGITTPSLANIVKDCTVMSNADTNLVFGMGGNLALAASVGNLITYLPTNVSSDIAETNRSLFSSPNPAGVLRLVHSLDQIKYELDNQVYFSSNSRKNPMQIERDKTKNNFISRIFTGDIPISKFYFGGDKRQIATEISKIYDELFEFIYRIQKIPLEKSKIVCFDDAGIGDQVHSRIVVQHIVKQLGQEFANNVLWAVTPMTKELYRDDNLVNMENSIYVMFRNPFDKLTKELNRSIDSVLRQGLSDRKIINIPNNLQNYVNKYSFKCTYSRLWFDGNAIIRDPSIQHSLVHNGTLNELPEEARITKPYIVIEHASQNFGSIEIESYVKLVKRLSEIGISSIYVGSKNDPKINGAVDGRGLSLYDTFTLIKNSVGMVSRASGNSCLAVFDKNIPIFEIELPISLADDKYIDTKRIHKIKKQNMIKYIVDFYNKG